MVNEEYRKLLEGAIYKRFGKRVTVKYDSMQYYVAQKDNYKFGLGMSPITSRKFVEDVMTEEDMELLQTNENN